MYLETNNERVAELVRGAMDEISLFRRTKSHDLLVSASAKLDEAGRKDPGYLQSLYGRAQLDDLSGRAKDAIEKLEHILEENPPFRDEVEYHLGVAYYHRYNRPNLEKAIERFSAVVARAGDPLLECRARLGIAQALGMRLIPSDPRNPDFAQLEADYKRLVEELQSAEILVRKLEHVGTAVLQELKSILHNSKALGWMYSTDFLRSREDKVELLQKALDELQQADKNDPNNWAIQCDIGSTWMRLGYWGQSVSSFENAQRHLNRVLKSLRPGYGFAVYELGRSYRLQGNFAQAIKFFDRALAIPYDYRDVSDRRLQLEKDRALSNSKEYP